MSEIRPKGRPRWSRRNVVHVVVLLTASSIAAALTFLPISRAYACSCFLMTEAEQFVAADIVFIGVVAFRQELQAPEGEEGGFPRAFFTFSVEERLKGLNRRARVGVTADGADSTCGPAFKVGERWRIYALKSGGAFGTGSCAANELLDADAPVPDIEPLPLPALAEPEPAAAPSPEPEPPAGLPVPALVFGAGAIVLIAGLSILAFSRGRSRIRAAR